MRIHWRNADRSLTETNRINHLLPVHQHRQCLPNTFVLEKRPIVVPHDFVLGGNGVLDLCELLLKGSAAGLFRVLNWRQQWVEVDLTGFDSGKGRRGVINDSIDDLVEKWLLAPVVVIAREHEFPAA